MTAFTDAVKASQSGLVYLVKAKEKKAGEDAWYYIQIDSKAKLPIFLEKVKTGLTLTDYGVVLYSGWGREPPEDIKQKIKERFG